MNTCSSVRFAYLTPNHDNYPYYKINSNIILYIDLLTILHKFECIFIYKKQKLMEF